MASRMIASRFARTPFQPLTKGFIMFVLLGSNGNITSKAARILLSQGKPVRVVGRSAQSLGALKAAGADIAVGDLTNAEFLAGALRGAQAVYTMIPPNYAAADMRADQDRLGEAITKAVAASGVTRLVDMGVEPYLITSSVECFMAQRLVRLLCTKCKQPALLNAQAAEYFGVQQQDVEDIRVYEAKGCSMCNFTGYSGRQGIYEFLVLNDEIRQLIMMRAPALALKEAALKAGMRTMMQDGWRKVRSGITSSSEILRVVREES
jgi:hypothetical protein